ncbi:MAG: GNAT family N-acetyltransferase [Saprospiraceae bacterium]
MQNLVIRKALPGDLDTLLRFEQGVIHAERPFDQTLRNGTISYYDLPEMLTDPDVEVVVAELGKEIIASGYARIQKSKPYLRHSTYAYLGFMFVVEEHRGKGVNNLILDALKKWTSSKGITEMRLEVYDDNIAAVKAYEKAGFKKHMIEMRMDI